MIDQAGRIADTPSQPLSLAIHRTLKAELLLYAGDATGCRDTALEACAICEREGLPFGYGTALVNLGWAEAQLVEDAFAAMRIAGIVVLVTLGVMMLRTPRHTPRSTVAPRPASGAGDFAADLTLVLSNPVNLMFFGAFLPQFIDPAALGPGLIAAASGLVLLASGLAVLAASGLGAMQARLAPASVHWVVRGGGVAMLGFAGFVAAGAM